MSAPALNPQQQAAVDRLAGDVFIDAGAGSGKTRVLAERFARLVAESAAPERDALRRVLLITFTEKAAGELLERVRRVFAASGRHAAARSVDEAWVMTIDGLCARIARRHALEAGIEPFFGVLVQPELARMQREAFESAFERLLGEPDVAALPEDKPLGVLRDLVVGVHSRVRAMGREATDVRIDNLADVRGELEHGALRLRELLSVLEVAGPVSQGAKNIGRLADVLAALATADLDSSEGLTALAEALNGKGFHAGVPDHLKYVVEDARAECAALAAVVAEVPAHRVAEAFRTLLVAYGEDFDALKTRAGLLDFADLEAVAGAVLRDDESCRDLYALFDAVMVDEFQDTNPLQVSITGPLSKGRLCAVGDERQSIYRFRFADVSVFRGLRDSMAEADPEALKPMSVNYRSHADLLETFNGIFTRGPFWPGDYMRLSPGRTEGWRVTMPEGSPRTELMLLDTSELLAGEARHIEARAIALRIRRLVDEGAARPDEIAVLFKAGPDAGIYAAALEGVGLDVYRTAGAGFYEAPEVRAAMDFLATVVNPRDERAVALLLSGVLGGMSDDGVLALSRLAAGDGLWRALERYDDADLTTEDVERAQVVARTVRRARALQGRGRVADLLLDSCRELGLPIGEVGPAAWPDIRKLARMAAEFERRTPADAGTFLRHIRELASCNDREAVAPADASSEGAVRMMTVHGAKGLEFPVVVVADIGRRPPGSARRVLVASRPDGPHMAAVAPSDTTLPPPPSFTAIKAAEEAESLEEDKRVFYVACTRAEELLILSGGADLSKEPGEATPMDWMRRVLGSDAPGRPEGLSHLEVAHIDPEVEDAGAAAKVAPQRATMGGGATTQAPEQPVTAPVADRVDVSPEWSYTALDVYQRCRYRFYAERVLGLRRPADPGQPAGPMVLGAAVHGALQLAHADALTEERLDAIAAFHRLDIEQTERLRDALEVFRGSAIAERIRGLERRRTEAAFAVGLASGTLAGSIDLLVRDGGTSVVVDYKTGSGELSADEARERFRLQAQCYGLAALASGPDRVEVVFIEVERGGRETTYVFDTSDRAGLEDSIGGTMARIATGEFPRREEYDPHTCEQCAVLGSLCGMAVPARKGRRSRS